MKRYILLSALLAGAVTLSYAWFVGVGNVDFIKHTVEKGQKEGTVPLVDDKEKGGGGGGGGHPTIPPAPTGVAAADGNAAATVSWNSASYASSYNLYWSTGLPLSVSESHKVSASSQLTYTLTGLTNETTYYFAVTGINSLGESVLSSTASAIPSSLIRSNWLPVSVAATGSDEIISGGAYRWQYSVLAFDSTGAPEIVYYYTSGTGADRQLKCVRWNGSSWASPFPWSPNNIGISPTFSFKLDGSNNQHFTYNYTGSANALHCVNWNGASLLWPSVDSTPGTGAFSSLAVDPDGTTLHTAYFGAYRELRYGRSTDHGANWQTRTLEAYAGVDPTVRTGLYPSIAVTASTGPCVSYYDEYAHTLRYAAYNASQGTWSTRAIDTEGGAQTALAIDGNGRPHISYLVNGGKKVKYAHWNGTAWVIRTIETLKNASTWRTSLVVDATNRPHIVYSGDGVLRYAQWNGTRWVIQTVGSDTGVMSPTIAMNPSTHAIGIAYCDGTRHVKYVE